jgi:uncharacterized protein YxjI
MFPDLASPKQPIAIRTEHIVHTNTSVRVQQQGKALSSSKFTIFSHNGDGAATDEATSFPTKIAEPQVLLTVDGKYMSKDTRRSFFDASGLPLFDLQQFPMSVAWNVEVPGGNGTSMARIMPRLGGFKDRLDCVIMNAAADSEEVSLRVQGQDIWKQRTNVYLGDKIVMTAKRTAKLSTYVPGMKVEWIVDIAAGMDVSLASVIVVVMAANMYDSATQASSKK